MTQLDTKETFQVPYIIRQCWKITPQRTVETRNWTTHLIHEKLLENALGDFFVVVSEYLKRKAFILIAYIFCQH